MAGAEVSKQEWETFLDISDRLGIEVRGLLERDVSFTEMELAGHQLGRAVAQATTERLALARAKRLQGPQPCPTCGRSCPLLHRDRELTTVDGPIDLHEAVCHCPTCRRDFFPSASNVGAGSTQVQSGSR
jgi:hypothetical protein